MHGTLSRNSVIGIVNCDLRVFIIQSSVLEEHFRCFIVLRRFLQVTREVPRPVRATLIYPSPRT